VIEEIGIVRRCGRCSEWLSIDQFRTTEKLCLQCRHWPPKKIGMHSSIRTLTITAKGRAFLQAERAAV